MTNTKKTSMRHVTARRVTGGLAALAAVSSLTAGGALAETADTKAESPILLAQAEGEGEAGASGKGEGHGEAAARAGGEGEGEARVGGEGEGEGQGDAALPADVALLSGLSFMEGHIRAGLTLYEAGDKEAALTHMGHPLEEKYDAIAGPLKEMGYGGLKNDIQALAAAAEAGAEFSEIQALFDRVRATHEAVRAEFSPAEQVDGLVALTRVAGDEYTVAVGGGQLSNLHEYQDSWGFLRVVETEAAQMAESDDAVVASVGKAILDQVSETGAAYGDIQGGGDFEMNPQILYGAAARMELAGLALAKTGEGRSSSAGEGEGETSSAGEGEGDSSSAGEGEGENG